MAIIVNTNMPPDSASVWNGATRMAVGKALLLGDGEAMTAAQMEEVLGQPHQSNLKKAADQLVVGGSLEAIPPPRDSHQGRPAETAFRFAEGERKRFEDVNGSALEPTEFQTGTPLVFVDAKHNRRELMRLLSLPGVLAPSARTQDLEGEDPQIMVSFDGPSAVEESREFLDLLGEAELKAKLRFIAETRSSAEMRKVARRSRQKAERVQAQLRSMQTGPRPEA